MALKAKIKLIVLTATMVVGILVTYGLINIANIPSISTSSEDMFTQSFKSFQTIYHLRDFVIEYYEKSEANCFVEGTGIVASLPPACICLPGWHGPCCDIPNEVFRSVQDLNRTIERRHRPRRLIFVLPLNKPVPLTLRTMHYLHDVVDVFAYGSLFDSNSTQNQLIQEQCRLEFGQQMLYVWNLNKSGPRNGVLNDPFRDLVHSAFFRLSEVRMDDLVVFSRSHQAASRNALLFLKLHDNFPEHISLNNPRASQSYAPVDVCTVASFLRCCQFDISKLQTVERIDPSGNLSEKWVMLPPQL